jgi:hypothetical protein
VGALRRERESEIFCVCKCDENKKRYAV